MAPAGRLQGPPGGPPAGLPNQPGGRRGSRLRRKRFRLRRNSALFGSSALTCNGCTVWSHQGPALPNANAMANVLGTKRRIYTKPRHKCSEVNNEKINDKSERNNKKRGEKKRQVYIGLNRCQYAGKGNVTRKKSK